MNTVRLFFIPVFLLVSALSFAQTADSISLKTEYQPNKSYFNKFVFNTVRKTSISGTEEFLQQMKDTGFNIPNEKEIKDSIEFSLVTGNRENDTIPVTLIVHNIPQLKRFPENTKVFGKYDGIHSPVFYDVMLPDSSQINEIDKKLIIQFFQILFKQSDSPRKSVKIGDEVSRSYEITIEYITGIPITTNVTTKYLLKKIDGNFAYLDYIQTISYSSNNIFKISGTGQASGTLIFDIENKVIHQSQLKRGISNIELKIDGWGTFSVEDKVDSQQTISVE